MVRQHTAHALGKLGDETAIPELVRHLHDESRFTRQGVAEALVVLGDPGENALIHAAATLR